MMDDLEINRLCAIKMDVNASVKSLRGTVMRNFYMDGNVERIYDPLHDDAQCFALVKKLKLIVGYEIERDAWVAMHNPTDSGVRDANLNRAICLCAAGLP